MKSTFPTLTDSGDIASPRKVTHVCLAPLKGSLIYIEKFKYTHPTIMPLCAKLHILLTCRSKVAGTNCIHGAMYRSRLILLPPLKATFCRIWVSLHAHVFEPIWPAVFLEKKSLAVGKTARDATLTLGRFRAIEIGYMLVSYITEPEMQLGGLFNLDSRLLRMP